MKLKNYFFLLFLIFNWYLFAQQTNTDTYIFDFNEQAIKEKNDKLQIKPVGITLTEDRFGNQASAIYLHGSPFSYLNLGSSSLLKPQVGTISIWVNLDEPVYAGKGDVYNPIICTKNGQANDYFNVAYSIGYGFKFKHLVASISKDSMNDVGISSKEVFKFGVWFHLVQVIGKDYLSFYVNGELQQKVKKNFEMVYLEGDSVTVGNTASKKNDRWSRGKFDDIQFYHRALTEKEILDLYLAPNPNPFQNTLSGLLKFGGVILGSVIVIIVVLIQNKRRLHRQKQALEMNNKISELELKVVKAQINPKFISLCLNAIRDLINQGNEEKAGQYIAKFSLFLRMVLNFSDRNFIALKDEVEIMQLNIELEALIHQNIFVVKYDIEASVKLNDTQIPSLISLPFIENAILNAVHNRSELGSPELRIHVFKTETLVCIEITNSNYMLDVENYRYHKAKGQELVTDKMAYLNELSETVNIQLKTEHFKMPSAKVAGTKIRIELLDNHY
jgi:Concanavalin A-like lectin/glucanases superfamily/Histidine kinase